MSNTTNVVTGVTSGSVVAASVYSSSANPNSLLSSPILDIFNGNYVLLVSDVTTIIGLSVGLAGVALGLLRLFYERRG